MKKLSKKITILLCICNVVFISCTEKIKLNMKEIPSKKIKMLSTEVTQELYEKVMGENPSYFQGTDKIPAEGEIQKKRPVESVSWFDAIYFCNKLSELNGKNPVYSVDGETDVRKWNYVPHCEFLLEGEIEQNINLNGYRLPTVEEWQYASRGGEKFVYSGSNNLDKVAWYYENSSKKTHVVGKKKSNGYGLYDMNGNVWEWCWDYWYVGKDGRYVCGGSWFDSAYYCTVDFKYIYGSDLHQLDDVGFRIVCSAE